MDFFSNLLHIPQLGASASQKEIAEFKKLDYFKHNRFVNPVETMMTPPPAKIMWDFAFRKENRYPSAPIPSIAQNHEEYNQAVSNEFPVSSWLGHSSIFLNMAGLNILIDPVFSKRASLFSFLGPSAFPYSSPISLSNFPNIDLVLISHDHYDHLDYHTIKQLKSTHFIVPLGVGAHLRTWGIQKDKIIELGRWQETDFKSLKITLTPTRHFSGRGLKDRFKSLWGGFALKGDDKNVFFSGDSGYFQGFKEIGKRLGPFDLAFIENGQYNKYWSNIHMMPEETALVGEDIGASYVVPVHWGKFSLSLHSWYEPVERFLKSSNSYSYKTLYPLPGAIISPADRNNYWWRNNLFSR